MANSNPDSINQNIQNASKNAVQVGGNYTHSSTINLNLLISVFFISILALGGLAWALGIGMNEGLTPQSTDTSPDIEHVEE